MSESTPYALALLPILQPGEKEEVRGRERKGARELQGALSDRAGVSETAVLG